jgi:hypothetical protein
METFICHKYPLFYFIADVIFTINFYRIYIEAYFLKARSVEPEKQPLLANGSETKFVSGNGRETDNGTTSVARQ